MSDEFHPYQTPIKQMNEQNMRACLKLFQLKGVFNPSYEMCSYLVSDNVSNRITFTEENLWKKKKYWGAYESKLTWSKHLASHPFSGVQTTDQWPWYSSREIAPYMLLNIFDRIRYSLAAYLYNCWKSKNLIISLRYSPEKNNVKGSWKGTCDSLNLSLNWKTIHMS
jgi:hypothetical protein